MLCATSASINIAFAKHKVFEGEQEITLGYKFAIVCFLFITVYQFSFSLFLWCKFDKLDSKEARGRYGEAYIEYAVEKKRKHILIIILVQFLRRAGLGIVLTFTQDNFLI